MDDEEENGLPERDEPSLAETVGAKESNKLRAKRQEGRGAWWGLGMMGMIGWSVAIPTLAGVLVGRWLDRENPGGRSWTLALLIAGLVMGCMNAWRWVHRENRAGHDAGEDGK